MFIDFRDRGWDRERSIDVKETHPSFAPYAPQLGMEPTT